MPDKYEPTPAPVIGFYVQPSPPDARDHIAPALAAPVALPAEFVQPMPAVKNQLHIGSCGAFGTIAALEYEYAKQGLALDLSEEYQYAVTRELMATLCQDSGSYPREAMRAATEYGALTEADVPYLSRDLCWNPGDLEDANAKRYRALEYFKVGPSREAIKAALYGTNGSDGHVIAYCTLVYANFGTDSQGYLHNSGASAVGAHWMDAIGFSEGRQAWRVRNSWGSGWGDGGYAWIRYADAERDPGQGGMWTEDAWALRIAYLPDPPPEPPEPPEPDTGYADGYRAARTAILEQLNGDQAAYDAMANSTDYGIEARRRYTWIRDVYLPWRIGGVEAMKPLLGAWRSGLPE